MRRRSDRKFLGKSIIASERLEATKLHEAILHRFARRDVMPLDLMVVNNLPTFDPAGRRKISRLSTPVGVGTPRR
jgi:hypothetical protein